MATCFRMSDLGALSYYIGIEVRQGKEALMLSQSAYASKLLERSSMTKCKSCLTLMEERLKLTKGSTAAKVDATLYWSIIGGLRYLVHTRPDIAFAVGYVSRLMENPREDHWAMVKRRLRYIKGTMDQVIVFPKTNGSGLQLTVFSDVDMAGDIDGRRSTSGMLVFLESALISWLSLKQKVVTLSTCEAEYVAVATAARQAVWLRRLLGYAQKGNSSTTAEESIIDTERSSYIHDYLTYLSFAIRKGADARDYFVWSLMDTFEWNAGYTVKYGLCHVDFKSLKRTPKLSAKWYSKFIKGYEQIEMASEESPNHMVS
ncbi:uncharacterized mitochondrial protein AtMg00810-like [Miscanthus floridulus]|uniref:uncharacterized mitochondrial protein AtMg00810-like n=1 Tax=Miscanthus floridulus TaxID=154761 RepID=UPI00345B3025